jgi:hypothetical protein
VRFGDLGGRSIGRLRPIRLTISALPQRNEEVPPPAEGKTDFLLRVTFHLLRFQHVIRQLQVSFGVNSFRQEFESHRCGSTYRASQGCCWWSESCATWCLSYSQFPAFCRCNYPFKWKEASSLNIASSVGIPCGVNRSQDWKRQSQLLPCYSCMSKFILYGWSSWRHMIQNMDLFGRTISYVSDTNFLSNRCGLTVVLTKQPYSFHRQLIFHVDWLVVCPQLFQCPEISNKFVQQEVVHVMVCCDEGGDVILLCVFG